MTFYRIGEKIQLLARMSVRCAAWVVLIASACCMQGIEAPGIPPVTSPIRPATKAAPSSNPSSKTGSATTAKPAAPPPSSNAVARPATVSLKDGKLTIGANNSDLGQILRDVAAVSGMTIDGLGKSVPVFGAFGPGNPSDVLTELLAGSGYDFMIDGRHPRRYAAPTIAHRSEQRCATVRGCGKKCTPPPRPHPLSRTRMYPRNWVRGPSPMFPPPRGRSPRITIQSKTRTGCRTILSACSRFMPGRRNSR